MHLNFLIVTNILIIDFYTFDIVYDRTRINALLTFKNIGIHSYSSDFWIQRKEITYVDSAVLLGVDNAGYLFIIVSTLTITLAVIVTYSNTCNRESLFNFLVYLITILINVIFLTFDIFLFFFFFEMVTIIIFFMIFFFGGSILKIRAGFLLLAYSLLSSSLILIYIFSCYSFNFDAYNFSSSSFKSTNYFLAVILFTALAIKLPLFPFHSWLPEAHAHASTVTSVILAASILKLGGYGFYRFYLLLFENYANLQIFSFLFIITSLISSIIICFKVNHIKQLFAYSSISHMSLSLMSLMTYSHQSAEAALILMYQHSVVTSVFFLLAGAAHDFYHTYDITAISNLSSSAPRYTFLFFFALLSNISFPLTMAFVCNYMIITSIFYYNILIFVITLITQIPMAAYSI